MRVAVAAVVVFALGGCFLVHERHVGLEHRLGRVASELAERPVHVHCQGLAGELLDVSADAGSVRFDASGAPSDSTDLKRPVCKALARYARDSRSSGYECVRANLRCPERYWDDVSAVHTLAHESRHLRGVASESEAECGALLTTARAALLLGADEAAAQATAVYARLHLYPALPSEYRSGACAAA